MKKVIDFVLGLAIWVCLFVLVSEKTTNATEGAYWAFKGAALIVGAVCTHCLTKRINTNGKSN